MILWSDNNSLHPADTSFRNPKDRLLSLPYSFHSTTKKPPSSRHSKFYRLLDTMKLSITIIVLLSALAAFVESANDLQAGKRLRRGLIEFQQREILSEVEEEGVSSSSREIRRLSKSSGSGSKSSSGSSSRESSRSKSSRSGSSSGSSSRSSSKSRSSGSRSLSSSRREI